MSNSNPRSRRRGPLPIILLFLGIGTGYLFFHRTTVPPTTIAPLSANLPPDEMSWSYRYIPGSWSWFWRLKSYICGPPRTVLIEANIIDLNYPPDTFLASLPSSGTEVANTNGIRVVNFTPEELKILRQRLNNQSTSEQSDARILTSPRIQTADSVGGMVTTSGTGIIKRTFGIQSGNEDMVSNIQLGTFPRLRDNATDLTATLLLTETSSLRTKTNMAVWIKSRITNACGLLLLDNHASTGTETKRSAVLISSTFISSKNNLILPWVRSPVPNSAQIVIPIILI